MEEMHATVSEIARQASSVSSVASQAAERAEASSGHAVASMTMAWYDVF